MRPTVTDVAWSVYVCVCQLVTKVSCAKTAELIEVSRCRLGSGFVHPKEVTVY